MTAVIERLVVEVDPRDPRARLGELVDAESLVPLRPFDDSGVYAVRGRVDGTRVIAYCVDTGLSADGCGHIVDAIEIAVREQCPVIGVWDTDGTQSAEAPDAVGAVFAAMVRASGRVPQISVGAGPALTDIVITSPDAYHQARRITSLLAQPGFFDLSAVQEDRVPPDGVIPLVEDLLDGGEFEQLRAASAPTVVIGLGRLGGRTVGVVATNPVHQDGRLDSRSAGKAARFVRMCDSFGVPLVVLADQLGVDRDRAAVVRHSAKLMYAFVDSVVPRVTLVTRDSAIAMNAKCLGATAVYAWPTAEAGEVDEIIEPAGTRRRLAEALAAAPAGRGSHGNIPL